MSNEESKIKHSKRLQQEENAIKKQVKIAKQHDLINRYKSPTSKQPHRFAKHHAMDCGNPSCYICGNPRKNKKDKLSYQEKRDFQEKLMRDS